VGLHGKIRSGKTDILTRRLTNDLWSEIQNILRHISIDEFCITDHNKLVIYSFVCTDTETLFRSVSVRRFKNIERVARRKLLQLHAATELASLRIPPGNQLEALKGNRSGQYSIRVNDQWRVCFVWQDGGAHRVEIVDYH
jgi:toxin HigB-1